MLHSTAYLTPRGKEDCITNETDLCGNLQVSGVFVPN